VSIQDEKMGPKMAKLTPKMRGFVLAIMAQGDRNATQAAATAGYSAKSHGSLKGQAHMLWHDERIQEAIHEEAHKRLKGLLPMAVNVVASIMENTQEAGATRLKAATITMDRAGLHAVSEKINTDGGVADDPDRLNRIMALARGLNMPLADFIGQRLAQRQLEKQPVITEADYVETSIEGLEGLI
jgi:hypothetical protein